MESNDIKQFEVGFDTPPSSVAPEIQETFSETPSETPDENLTEELPELQEPEIIDEGAETGGQDGGEKMSMDFIDPEMMMIILNAIVVFSSVLIFQRLYDKKYLNKKKLQKDAAFTAQEKKSVQPALERWINSMQVRRPSPFLEFVIVLLVVLGCKAYFMNEEISEEVEQKKAEDEIKRLEAYAKEQERRQSAPAAVATPVPHPVQGEGLINTPTTKKRIRPKTRKPGETRGRKPVVEASVDLPVGEDTNTQKFGSPEIDF